MRRGDGERTPGGAECELQILRGQPEAEGDRDRDRATGLDGGPLPAAAYQVGPFLLQSWALPHFVPNAGVRLSAPGLTVAYTGDTGPDPALADLGRDADLYVMEASDRYQQAPAPPAAADRKLHLSAAEAGAAAAAAGARRLLLSHFWPGNDRAASGAAAAAHFSGEILLAEEGMEIPLP